MRASDARPYWREKEVAPGGQGDDYNYTAETYMELCEEGKHRSRND